MTAPDVSRTSLPRVLQSRAESTPQLAFRFLRVGTGDDTVDWTYRELADHAGVVAADLTNRNLRGRRVMLALDPGVHYMAALFGILQAGATAVPSFPPAGKRASARFTSIYQSCLPSLVIADSHYDTERERLNGLLDPSGGQSPEWLMVDECYFGASLAGAGPPNPAIADDAVIAEVPALLQYTSGSTGTPKGVVVTHDNLVSNSRTLEHNMGHDPDRVGCSWLPPYHDMGLIGTIVLAVFSGWPLVVLSPVHFVQNPYRWLKAITDNGVTISVTPNFALDLCAATISDEEIKTLDLSTLRQVYCGAEPVLKRTLDAFAERFSACGYSEAATIPCYGMAEATLYLSGKPDGTAPRTTWLDKAGLEAHRVQVAAPGADGSTEVVSCGEVTVDHELVIVDPQTRRPVESGGAGEIWVHGPNVAAGYVDRPEESAATFAARLADDSHGERTFLRTGDLGFLLDDELYVTGRLKDLIIIAGRNIHPQDVEQSVREACPGMVRGVAAFPVPGDKGEELVVVVELMRGSGCTAAEVDEIKAGVMAGIATDHRVTPADVYVGPRGAVRTTTSGKVQRRATRQGYLEGSLKHRSPAGATTALTRDHDVTVRP